MQKDMVRDNSEKTYFFGIQFPCYPAIFWNLNSFINSKQKIIFITYT